jgi:protein O-GlcNAc transferase
MIDNANVFNLQTTLEQAVIYHQEGQLPEAEQLYRSILQVFPLHPDANHNLGALAVQVQQTSAGLPHFKIALEANSGVAQYWSSYVEALIYCGHSTDAYAVLAQGQRRGLRNDIIHALLIKLAALSNSGATAVFPAPIRELSLNNTVFNGAPNQREMDTLMILYHQGKFIELERLARALMEKFPEHGFGWKMLGGALLQQGFSIEAIMPMRMAATLLVDADSYYNLGVAFQGMYHNKEAEASYRQAISINPDYAEAYSNLGIILKEQERFDDAIFCYRQALEITPNFAEGHCNLGNVLRELGRLAEAETSYFRAIEINPDFVEAHSNLGICLKEQNRFVESEASCRRALKLRPDFTDAHGNLGAALQGQGRFAESEKSYRRAVEITPESADLHFNLGVVLQNQRRYAEAEPSYLRSLQLVPGLTKASNNLATILNILGRFSEAEIVCRRALELAPEHSEVCVNLAITLKALGRSSEAELSCRLAIKVNPDSAAAYSNLGNILQDQGRHIEAEQSYWRALEIRPDWELVFDNLLFGYIYQPEKSVEEIALAYRRYDAQFGLPQFNSTPHTNVRDPVRRLKIGYVSADFRTHAVAAFIEPVLSSHDKSVFEVFCYSNHARHDAVTEKIKNHVDHWRLCVELSDDRLAECIRADGIDLLIDLSGHTADNRLLTFARKPAPVQLTYLGYPGTSGLSAMDYRITDGYADPLEGLEYYSEKLLRLPDSLCCYRPVIDMPEVGPLPALKNGYITFGSFNNSSKVDNNAIVLWSKILLSLPSSRLLMVTIPEGERRETIARQFEAAGVTRDRIDFQGKLLTPQFHKLFQQVDIALDPLLMTGGTTTCESLWMGVPVIVMKGKRFIHRVGYSFLCSAGLARYAAKTPDEYVQIALAAAADIQGLAQLRAGMREQLAVSALMDQAHFTRNFEKILREAWHHWCTTEPMNA